MAKPRRGRPPNPVDPDASHGARLGFEIRTRRIELDLTLDALGKLTQYTAQYISEVERAKTIPAQPFIAACERSLDASGELEPLLPEVLQERERKRQERAAARRATAEATLPCEDHGEALGDDEDVDPTNRRGLLGAGAAAALSAAAVGAVPASAEAIDRELPTHWADLLNLLGRHDALFGPCDVLTTVRRELSLITAHREVARGELRVQLMRVEARWAGLAAWLSNDMGDHAVRDAWTNRALRLAQEAAYPDMMAFARWQQVQWAAQERDGRRASRLAEAGLRIRGTGAQIRALCSSWAAIGYGITNDAAACERYIVDAYRLEAADDSPAPPWAGGFRVTHTYVRMTEARCWLAMRPTKAITLYEGALRDWPRHEARAGGLHQARLARACAATGERDRARAEGRKALAIAQATKSITIERELRRLGTELRAA